MRHRWIASILIGGALLLASACENAPEPVAPALPPPTPSISASLTRQQVSLDQQIERLIPQLFKGPLLQVAVFIRHEAVELLLAKGKTAAAQQLTFDLVTFVLQKYNGHQLIGDQSPGTQSKLQSFIDLCFQFAGLGPAQIPLGALGSDGVAAVVGTSGGTVVTPSQQAGTQIPSGALNNNVIVTLNLDPDQQHPLPSAIGQFPPFYDVQTFPAVPQTGQPLIVGICVNDDGIPEGVDPQSLRLAHPSHADPSTIEILPKVAAPFLSCAPFGMRHGFFTDLANAGKTVAGDLFWVMMGAPKDLSATSRVRVFNPGGLGGKVSSLSPFGAVDFSNGFVPYQDSGYRYLEIGTNDPPNGFEQPGFNASSWSVGRGAFGGGNVSGVCPQLQSSIHTSWPAASDGSVQILLRKGFSGTAQNVQIQVPVDNDVRVYVNGTEITASGGTVDSSEGVTFIPGSVDVDGFMVHENCADPAHPFVFPVNISNLLPAGNLVVVQARDRGSVSYVDVRVTGTLPE